MDKQTAFTIRFIIGLMALVTLGLGIYYFMDTSDASISYFTEHFLSAVALFCIGVIALLLPVLNGTKLSGTNQGDSLMIVVGILLMLCAILSIIMSYSSTGGLI